MDESEEVAPDIQEEKNNKKISTSIKQPSVDLEKCSHAKRVQLDYEVFQKTGGQPCMLRKDRGVWQQRK